MVKLEYILSIIVGISLFLTDLVFGWLTFLSGPIPVIFVMAIIIGIVAGTNKAALSTTFLSWIGGIGIGILIAPIVFVDIMNPDQTLLGLVLFIPIYSLRGTFAWTFEGNIVEIMVVGLVLLVVMLILTPIIYLFSFVFSVIGALIGKYIRKQRSVSGNDYQPGVQEPTGIQ